MKIYTLYKYDRPYLSSNNLEFLQECLMDEYDLTEFEYFNWIVNTYPDWKIDFSFCKQAAMITTNNDYIIKPFEFPDNFVFI